LTARQFILSKSLIVFAHTDLQTGLNTWTLAVYRAAAPAGGWLPKASS